MKYASNYRVVLEGKCIMARRYLSSVRPKGQITLPAAVRREFDINPRDHVVFEVADGEMRVIPEASSLETVFASVPALSISYEDGALERIAKNERVHAFAAKMRES